MAVVELIRQLVLPGEEVVITPPVYPPFWEYIREAGARAHEVSLRRSEGGWSLDLDALDRAFAAGARVMLLCNPHNPVGLLHSRKELASLSEIAANHGVIVISDEIHGPLTHPDNTFTPFLSTTAAAREYGVTVTSASKAFNLAGLKCALIVTESERVRSAIASMSAEVPWRTSILGLHASAAAFEHGDPWLDECVAEIRDSSVFLQDLLTDLLPGARYSPPGAGYLAWVDFTKLGWGDDPSSIILKSAGVALSSGPSFGRGGTGFARLNFACSRAVLSEAIERMADAHRAQ